MAKRASKSKGKPKPTRRPRRPGGGYNGSTKGQAGGANPAAGRKSSAVKEYERRLWETPPEGQTTTTLEAAIAHVDKSVRSGDLDACLAVMDRCWGRPRQALDVTQHNPIEHSQEITDGERAMVQMLVGEIIEPTGAR